MILTVNPSIVLHPWPTMLNYNILIFCLIFFHSVPSGVRPLGFDYYPDIRQKRYTARGKRQYRRHQCPAYCRTDTRHPDPCRRHGKGSCSGGAVCGRHGCKQHQRSDIHCPGGFGRFHGASVPLFLKLQRGQRRGHGCRVFSDNFPPVMSIGHPGV